MPSKIIKKFSIEKDCGLRGYSIYLLKAPEKEFFLSDQLVRELYLMVLEEIKSGKRIETNAF